MTTKIAVERMRFHARHGVSEQERAVGNDFEVTLEVAYPLAAAMESDALTDTLDYTRLYDAVAQEMAIPSRLLERVAGRILARLSSEFPLIEGGKLTVTKLSPPISGEMACVSVTVEF